MMTKKEVAAIVMYCQENNVSYWFLQLVPGESFLPNPIQPSRSRSARQKVEASGSAPVNIELRTVTGTVMRISGSLTGRLIQDIILASSARI